MISNKSAKFSKYREATRHIMLLDLGLHSYKILETQILKPHEHKMRSKFGNSTIQQLNEDSGSAQTMVLTNITQVC